MVEISVKEKFGRVTGLRHSKISEKSGEDFYHEVLNEEFYKAIKQNKKLLVNLDGIRSYSPSFIDESFGNLVFDFGEEMIKKWLIVKSDEKPFWINSIEGETIPLWEKRRIDKDSPLKTKKHKDWWSWDIVKQDFYQRNDSV